MICISGRERYLYPTGCPFIHAQKAESTASKCNKILLPTKNQSMLK